MDVYIGDRACGGLVCAGDGEVCVNTDHSPVRGLFFFFNDTATTEIYTLSLHDALPISSAARDRPREREAADRAQAATHPNRARRAAPDCRAIHRAAADAGSGSPLPTRSRPSRSEEHTSELQSPCNLVCRLLLEKKKNKSGRYHAGEELSRRCQYSARRPSSHKTVGLWTNDTCAIDRVLDRAEHSTERGCMGSCLALTANSSEVISARRTRWNPREGHKWFATIGVSVNLKQG